MTVEITHDELLHHRITFDTAIDQLTRPVPADGHGHIPSLLDQLTDAIEPGNESTGKTAAGSRPPASMSALALAADIGIEMRQALAILGETCPTDLSAQVRCWASHAENWHFRSPDYLTYAADRATHWVTSIRALLDPPRRHPIRGRACPSCWQTTVHVWSDDIEDHVRRPALIIDLERAEASCAGCAATWPVDRWEQLASALHQQQHVTLSVRDSANNSAESNTVEQR